MKQPRPPVPDQPGVIGIFKVTGTAGKPLETVLEHDGKSFRYWLPDGADTDDRTDGTAILPDNWTVEEIKE